MSSSITEKYDGAFIVQQGELSSGKLYDWSVAVNPTIDKSTQQVTWHDGNRGRVIDYEKGSDVIVELKKNKSTDVVQMVVKDESHDFVFILKPLTLEKYNKFIKERIAGHPSFKTKRELTAFFKKMGR